MVNQQQKILAIDFGTKRLGLATNHFGLAEPLTIVPYDDQSVAKIKQLLKQEKIELVLVGISESAMAEKTRQFVQSLAAEIDLPIELIDETLSSKKVHQQLAQAKVKLKKRQGPIDHYAAAVMLQDWLEMQPANELWWRWWGSTDLSNHGSLLLSPAW